MQAAYRSAESQHVAGMYVRTSMRVSVSAPQSGGLGPLFLFPMRTIQTYRLQSQHLSIWANTALVALVRIKGASGLKLNAVNPRRCVKRCFRRRGILNICVTPHPLQTTWRRGPGVVVP